MNNKVTIIIPMYNCENTIKKCIETVINQTYENLEILLIDDGSNDETYKKCEVYLKDDRVKYYYKNNTGVSETRNYGLKKATGDYIFFIDADDWLELNAIERMIGISIENDADIVQSNLILVEQNKFGKRTDFYNIKQDLLINDKERKEELLETIISYEMSIVKYNEKYGPSRCAGGKLYKKNILKGKFLDTIYILEDGIFNYNAIINSKNIYIMKDSIYNYRIFKESTSSKKTDDLLEQYRKVLDKVMLLPKIDNMQECISLLRFELISSYITRFFRTKNINYNKFCYDYKILIKLLDPENILKKINYSNVENKKKIVLFFIKNNMLRFLYYSYFIKER